MNRSSRWSRGPFGLEVTTPHPGLFRRGFLGLLLVALLVCGFAALIDGDWRAPFLLVQFFVGLPGLGVLAALALVALVFDRKANERTLLDAQALNVELRLGQAVVSRSCTPLAAIDAVEVAPDGEGCRVTWRPRDGGPLPYTLARGLAPEDALALTEQVRAWIAAPPAVIAANATAAHAELPRLILGFVAARARTAIPLAVLGVGLMLLGCAWNLRGEKYATAPARDTLAAGELLRYRWVVREPNTEERALHWTHGVVQLELGVGWNDAAGRPRRLWWRSSEDIPIDMLAESRIARIAPLIGLPWIELALPAAARRVFEPGGDPGFDRLLDEVPAEDAPIRALVDGFDDPLSLMAATALARSPDWRVAYAADAPERATLATLAAIEDNGLQRMPIGLLLVVGSVGALLIFASLRPLLSRRWLARGVGAVLVVGVALWAPRVERWIGWFGVDAALASSLRAAALGINSDAASAADYYLLPLAAPTEPADALVVRWRPERSAASDVIARLGLDQPVPGAIEFGPLRDALERRASERIAALDDAALVALIERWKPEEFGRYRALRVAYVRGLCMARTQTTRGENTRGWIDYALSNPVICQS